MFVALLLSLLSHSLHSAKGHSLCLVMFLLVFVPESFFDDVVGMHVRCCLCDQVSLFKHAFLVFSVQGAKCHQLI